MKSLYLPPDQWREPFVLEGSEAHHLLKVLRARPGDTIRAIDGCGRSGIFAIQRLERKAAYLDLISEQTRPPREREIILALGWNKTARRGWLLEKAVELEASGIVFWQAERSQGRAPDIPKESWSAQLVAAAKQCGNARLPFLGIASGGATELVRQFGSSPGKLLLWEHVARERLFNPGLLPATGRTIIVLGPEGGLTDEEAHVFIQAGFDPLSLGRSVLRWETAALLCLGLCYWANQ
ncbi:16S rRNA (uracil1498-N3)-methyltransferase [Desulfonatronum thiosulfatophilum]|uniref:Ribosomal RNA small subunit methyltransferase E n=1 Tax=Desulfonatronum thiosulfatophilum TaxID=617002 RepID=A0A1G6CID6_9BACT|nr:16S rRNA (uracil(1498)-N(3))-methyltransferase [Desulfonatronum thiosulfatophilum]SDB32525.1 16S rRNA (uracil1498-N3)-methyltransferase [Desulfonatronum thiosulfatophilum]